MLLALILCPLVLALVAALPLRATLRPWLVPLGGVAHLSLTIRVLVDDAALGWLALDGLTRLGLGFLSVLFLGCALYVPGYLKARPERPNRLFCACLLGLLSMMSLMMVSQHLGLMWVALEAATLATAPLIGFNRSPRSLEATWKYLLLGSVGIALALFGSYFLAYAALEAGARPTLLLPELVAGAPELSKPWLKAAFVLLLIGYGTKMGLAPMHTWKPDAYGEASGVVGALLAGGLTSCAFVAILRFYRVMDAAGEGVQARAMLLGMGLLSMAVAAVFMAGQRDLKRLLAYSSVEHMGILVVGVGLGAVEAALFHLLANGVTKGLLFLSVGNLHRAYGSKSVDQVKGALIRSPASASLFLVGFFAITGAPLFGPFVSEFLMVKSALASHQFAVAGAFLVLLAAIFFGLGHTVLKAVFGTPPDTTTAFKDSPSTVAPLVFFLALSVMMGTYVPAPVRHLLADAAAWLRP